jgi:hypothetical protein
MDMKPFDESSVNYADIYCLMEFIEHPAEGGKIVEISSDKAVIQSEEDALDIMASIRYLYDSQKIIVYKENLGEDFFDLSSGLAGGILQKFSNYRVRLAIVGNFSGFESLRLKELILESNKGRQVNFVTDLSLALEVLRG